MGIRGYVSDLCLPLVPGEVLVLHVNLHYFVALLWIHHQHELFQVWQTRQQRSFLGSHGLERGLP